MKPVRKSDPEIVKARLLAATEALAAEKGLAAVTLEAVARQAGLSKGGLLHHYPGRQALILAVSAALFARWDEKIRRFMADDPEARGRFSRAYVRSLTETEEAAYNMRLVGALVMAISGDAALRGQWRDWLEAHLTAAGPEEREPPCTLARAAADGLWLAAYTGTPVPGRADIERALLDMTRQGVPQDSR